MSDKSWCINGNPTKSSDKLISLGKKDVSFIQQLFTVKVKKVKSLKKRVIVSYVQYNLLFFIVTDD